uniref:Uncharacterized protein n=1 Tax=Tetranychus urticae TaxID=32264 RepID=T1JTQ9_TETUR
MNFKLVTLFSLLVVFIAFSVDVAQATKMGEAKARAARDSETSKSWSENGVTISCHYRNGALISECIGSQPCSTSPKKCPPKQ